MAIKSSSWVAVDEGMTLFTGRSKDKVILKHKPITEGYKAWQLVILVDILGPGFFIALRKVLSQLAIKVAFFNTMERPVL